MRSHGLHAHNDTHTQAHWPHHAKWSICKHINSTSKRVSQHSQYIRAEFHTCACIESNVHCNMNTLIEQHRGVLIVSLALFNLIFVFVLVFAVACFHLFCCCFFPFFSSRSRFSYSFYVCSVSVRIYIVSSAAVDFQLFWSRSSVQTTNFITTQEKIVWIER